MIRSFAVLTAIGLGGGAVALSAQSNFQLQPMARAVLLGTSVDPKPGKGSLTEVRLVQPVASALLTGFGGRFKATATLDVEGLTMPDGELTPGAWGEGFVDRRHPHTTVHELNVALVDLFGRRDGRAAFGVIVGKGFVPFGTDDPMSRPLSRYPVNHHLAQILERAVVAAQFNIGMLTLEGALFNGDEPERPGQWPLLKSEDGSWRFGDSWSTRVTIRPVSGLEVQASRATAHSPEHRQGAGEDALKTSLSARWHDRPDWGERYVMAEWARTSELDGFFVFRSLLAEAMVRRGRWSVAYRYEQTDRPEEERLDNLFRTRRPHFENSILGIGRWSLHTIRVGSTLLATNRRTDLSLFTEGTLGNVAKQDAGIFDPQSLYGTTTVRQLSVGVALSWGMRGHRMGRYGVLASGHDEMNEHQH